MAELDEKYWSERYKSGLTGWDIGFPSTPIVQYLDQIVNKDVEILIPGSGNAYEAYYAFQSGFSNVHVLDISQEPLRNFKDKFPNFPSSNLHHGDFFEHHGSYNLILEQTFFCALNPSLRPKYVKKMSELLLKGGKLVGLLFNKEFNSPGPPFGGGIKEYQKLFHNSFEIDVMEECYNSIPARAGSEAFIRLINSKG